MICFESDTVNPTLSQQLAGLTGEAAIVPRERLQEYAVDGLTPSAVTLPRDRKEVAEVLKWASHQHISVFTRGGGTQMSLGNVPETVGLVLGISGLSRILDHQPADLTATVEAGITLDRLQQELSSKGQFLPLQTPLAANATVGGTLAANVTGPLRISYGQPRDWLIGISVVGAGGVETKAGGKVVKNVTGYDLNKLYTGSLGTLGIIVEATFKLSPMPPRQTLLLAGFRTLAAGVEATRKLLQEPWAPQGLQVADGPAAGQLNAAFDTPLPGQLGTNGALAFVFFSGRARAVQRRVEECIRSLLESGATGADVPDEAEGGRSIKGLTDLGWSQTTKPYLGIKVNVPPSSLAQVVGSYQQDSSLGLPPGIIADPAFGMARLFWRSRSVSDWMDDSLVLDAIFRIRELTRVAGGTTLVEHCPFPLKKQIDVWGDHPQGMEIMRRIKQKFDPLGILNPGRFAGRL